MLIVKWKYRIVYMRMIEFKVIDTCLIWFYNYQNSTISMNLEARICLFNSVSQFIYFAPPTPNNVTLTI